MILNPLCELCRRRCSRLLRSRVQGDLLALAYLKPEVCDDSDMEPVVIGNAGRTLTFSEPHFDGVLPTDYLSVTLSGPDLSASRQVYAGWEGGFTHLATFFADLADQWRGWQGERVFESVEGDLRIQASHDGHVNLRVLLWESTSPEGWKVQAEVRLDAGEALSSAATDMALLVQGRTR